MWWLQLEVVEQLQLGEVLVLVKMVDLAVAEQTVQAAQELQGKALLVETDILTVLVTG
jgi:hypothetical protein